MKSSNLFTLPQAMLIMFVTFSLMLTISCTTNMEAKEPLDTVWGMVRLDEPVSHANVAVYSGSTLVWEGASEDGSFHGTTGVSSSEPVRVVVTDVVVDDAPVHVTLSMYQPAYEPDDHLTVNVFTTLVDRYRLAYNSGHEEALFAVKRHLNLPLNLNYSEKQHFGSKRMYLDASLLLEMAATEGTLDAFLDVLVGRMSDEAARSQFGALNAPQGEGSIFADIAIAAAKGAGSSLAEAAMGEALKKFGFAKGDTAVQDELRKLNERLAQIEQQLLNLRAHLEGLIAKLGDQVDQGFADILFGNQDSEVRKAVGYLDELIDRLADFTPEAAESEHPLDPHDFAISMISNYASIQFDVPTQLATIHNAVMPTPEQRGAIGAYAISLSRGGGPPNDVLTAYMALEAYFGKILAYQYRGLILMTEAINMLEPEDTGVQYKDIELFTGKLQKRIDAQVEEFLLWVDYLVFANSDFGTDLVAPRQFLPDGAGIVYKRADFVAQQISKKHPAGTVFRLIGQPAEIAAFLEQSDQRVVQTRNGEVFSYDLEHVYDAVYNLNSKNFLVTSESTPKWETPYIAWSFPPRNITIKTPLVTRTIHFSHFPVGESTSEVTIAKFVLGADTKPLAEGVLDSGENHWGFAGAMLEMSKSAGDVLDLAGYYRFVRDEDSELYNKYVESDITAEGSFAYGAHLLPVRLLPSGGNFSKSTPEPTSSPKNTMKVSFDANVLRTILEADITKVHVDKKSHCSPDGSCWSTWYYKGSYSLEASNAFFFTLSAPKEERWRIASEGRLRYGHDSSWNIKTTAKVTVGSETALNKTIKNPYAWSNFANEYQVRAGSREQFLSLGISISGGVNETMEQHKNPPAYTIKAAPEYNKLRFESY